MPFQSLPYAPPTMYQPRYGDSIAELIMRQGDIAARGAERSGEIWGNAIGQLGQIAGGTVERVMGERKQKERAAALNEALASYNPQDPMSSYRRIAPIVGPEPAYKILEGMEKAQSMAAKGQKGQPPTIDEFNKSLAGLHAMNQGDPAFLPNNWDTVRQVYGPGALTHYGYQLPEQYSPEVGQRLDSLAGALNKTTTEAPHTMPIPQPDGTVKTFQWDPKGRTWAEAPGLPSAAAKAAPLQHVETAAGIQTFDPGKGTLGPVIAQGKPSASLIVNPGKEADTTSNAESIVNGTLLPSMLSKRSADFNHLIAVANKVSIEKSGKPMNFTKLQLDYEASKRFVGSLNGNQMIRFKGLAGSVVNTIDEVKNLAEELKQGGVQRWNQAKRDTILQVYGNTPQSALAARYVSAVNTLKEEFANLAQGGYAPTEEAWRLANQQINGNYGLKDFSASLTEAQRLINYRLGAFDELGPSLLGGGGQTFGGAGRAPAATGKTDPMGLR